MSRGGNSPSRRGRRPAGCPIYRCRQLSRQKRCTAWAGSPRRRRFAAALIAFDKVLARDRGSVDALFERGNVLAALSRFDEAVASYEAALGKAPAHIGALTNRGNALARLRRDAEALACYDQLL